MKNRKKWLAALLLLALALPGAGVAEEELAMSDVENMTAPGVLPIVTEPVTITIAIESNSTVTDYEDNAWTRWLEEQTGIDIEIVLLPTENPGEWLYFDLVPEQYEIRKGRPDYTGKVCVIGSSLKEEALNQLFGRG